MSIAEQYRKIRTEHPFLSAIHAYAWAKHSDDSEEWEVNLSSYGEYKRTIDQFLVKLRVEPESECPKEDDGLGHYAKGVSSDYDYEWNGNYPRPDEPLPLNLPYTSFASGAYSQDRHAWPYFIPDHVEEQYESFRKMGQSKSVSWMLTKEWVEDTISKFFGGPLYYGTILIEVFYVTADGEEIEIGSDSLGTSYLEDEEIFTIVKENAMVDTALDEARKHLEELKEVV